MPRDVLMVESVDQAAVLLKPLRVAMLREMAQPRTCPQLAERFGDVVNRPEVDVLRLPEVSQDPDAAA